MNTHRQRLDDRRGHHACTFEHERLRHHCTFSRFPDGRLAEIFLACSKAGSAAQANADCAAILTSLLLQYGVPAGVIRHAVRGSAVAVAIDLAESSA